MHQVIRVIAVDPHPVFLEGIARSLRGHDDLVIIGLTSSTNEFVSLARLHQPDVVLIDALMEGGIEAARSVANDGRGPKIIMLADSIESIPEMAVEISGGHAWILKTTGGAYLAWTIRVTLNGGFTIGPGLSGRIVLIGDRLIDQAAAVSAPVCFSGRENDVMRRVCQGMSNRDMATDLGIRETTVRNYIVKIKRKLKATNRRDIARLSSRYIRNMMCLLLGAATCTQHFVGYAIELL
jgi:DNA-binding NarL/FixJ family response regulator